MPTITVVLSESNKEKLGLYARAKGIKVTTLINSWIEDGCPTKEDNAIDPMTLKLLKELANHSEFKKRNCNDLNDVLMVLVRSSYRKCFPDAEDKVLEASAVDTIDNRWKKRLEQTDIALAYSTITKEEASVLKDEAAYYHRGLVDMVARYIMVKKLVELGYKEDVVVNGSWMIEKYIKLDRDFVDKFRALGLPMENPGF